MNAHRMVRLDPDNCGFGSLDDALEQHRKQKRNEEYRLEQCRRNAELDLQLACIFERMWKEEKPGAEQERERQGKAAENYSEYEEHRLEQCRRNAKLDAQLARIFGRMEEVRNKQEEVRMTKTHRPLEGEIIRSDGAIAIKPMKTDDFDALREHLQNLIRQMVETLDISKREGFLDRLRGIGGRIDVKIERAGQLGELVAAFGNTIDELRTVAEKLGQLNRVAVQQQLLRMQDEYELIQAQIRIDSAHEEARERGRIEKEKVDAEIERIRAEKSEHQARIRENGLRGYPAPPPIQAPPPPPPPPPEDPRAKAKANYERELERLNKEEVERIFALTGWKPQAEWSDDTRAEVIRTKNMYADKREKVRDKLRRVL